MLGKPKLFSLLDLTQIPFIFALTRYSCSVHNHTLFYKLCSWNRYMYLVRVFGRPFTEVLLMCDYFLLRNMVMVPLFQSLHLMQKLIVNCYGRPWEEQVSFQLFIQKGPFVYKSFSPIIKLSILCSLCEAFLIILLWKYVFSGLP